MKNKKKKIALGICLGLVMAVIVFFRCYDRYTFMEYSRGGGFNCHTIIYKFEKKGLLYRCTVVDTSFYGNKPKTRILPSISYKIVEMQFASLRIEDINGYNSKTEVCDGVGSSAVVIDGFGKKYTASEYMSNYPKGHDVHNIKRFYEPTWCLLGVPRSSASFARLEYMVTNVKNRIISYVTYNVATIRNSVKH